MLSACGGQLIAAPRLAHQLLGVVGEVGLDSNDMIGQGYVSKTSVCVGKKSDEVIRRGEV